MSIYPVESCTRNLKVKFYLNYKSPSYMLLDRFAGLFSIWEHLLNKREGYGT